MIKNTIKTITVDRFDKDRVFVTILRNGEVYNVREFPLGSASAKRVDRVLNTEIVRFTYSLKSYLFWGNGSTTLIFQRNVLPAELTENEDNKALWLHVLYPALFDWKKPDEENN